MMAPSNQFNLMIWNAQSVRNKKDEFLQFLDFGWVDVVLMSETHLTATDSCKHPNYITYRLDRDDGRRGGGVAIFLRRGIKHLLLPCPKTKIMEALSIKIFLEDKPVVVSSIYFPGSSSSRDLTAFRQDLELLTSDPVTIVGGDFNSRHYSWNCSRNNSAGNTLYHLVQNDDLLIHFPPTHTHFSHNRRSLPSTIDLIVTKGISNQCDTFTDDSISSDHVPVICSIALDVLGHTSQ